MCFLGRASLGSELRSGAAKLRKKAKQQSDAEQKSESFSFLLSLNHYNYSKLLH
jgi:hypothetical protein